MSGLNILLKADDSLFPNTSDFTVNFAPPIQLIPGMKYELACLKSSWYNSYFNISPALNNNTFRYYNGVVWTVDTIPSGHYSVQSLYGILQQLMINDGNATYSSTTGTYSFSLVLTEEPSSGGVNLILLDSYELDLTVGTVGYLNVFLGFNSGIYTTTTQSQSAADVLNNIADVLVHCSLLQNASWVNNSMDNVLLSEPADGSGPNGLINVSGSLGGQIFYPINQMNQIQSIRVYWTDGENNPLNLNNYATSVMLYLRPILNGR